jgi:coenzyme F420-dependent glucose-6-phosphate dehydrogenase
VPEFGYHLSAEEHAPLDLVRNAKRAEEEGFGYALVSDHFHPWLDQQGHSGFVWSVIGGIALQTERLELGTGVTCPLIRTHPAIIAHAAATAATMMPGRFFLGLGTGENLNEHVLGDRWPAPDDRLAMLEEAIELMRTLWEGGYQTFRGDYYVVEQAKLYDLPEEPMRVMVAASKPNAAELAGREGDGLITTAPDEEVVAEYREAGGSGPRYGKVTLCWAESEQEAQETAYRFFANTGAPGELNTELALPRHYEQVAELLEPSDMADLLACGPDPEKVIEQVREYEQAGLDHLYLHQVGPDQEGFFRFWREELKPRLDS